ncbi:transporter substrate-binding domain-containing protein [Zoogloea sp.]|uniref:transporter substrate-binding domain-containing protein n=1 Tax=Zoogloea sp. TaxID=49181 RepID=UPI00260CDFEE|nr:transporter substrate-binding domain-containing protein [uncultured Zoogloea sp.]
MRSLSRRVWLLSTFLAIVLAVPGELRADLLGDIRGRGALRVAIAGSVPPYNAYRPDGAAEGSDVDVARALARDLGVRLEIVRITNSERVAVLLARRADVVISALSITPERERLIAFSVPYASIGVFIAAPLPLQLSSLLDLKGRRVGVLAGSSNFEHLLRHVPEARLRPYAEHDLLVSAYLAGDFEIISATESVVADVNARQPLRPLVEQFQQSEFDLAVGMPKGEKALRDWINAWIVARLRDQSLAAIHLRHHRRGALTVQRPAAGR